jgi:hypothetical protein
MPPKITKTFVRTPETMAKYVERNEARRNGEEFKNPFTNWQDNVIQEFNHWVIISNQFPYDAIATTSHMISTKREVGFDWNLLNEEEKAELKQLKETYLKEHYDLLWENLPRGATILSHFHLHLLVLKRE